MGNFFNRIWFANLSIVYLSDYEYYIRDGGGGGAREESHILESPDLPP